MKLKMPEVTSRSEAIESRIRSYLLNGHSRVETFELVNNERNFKIVTTAQIEECFQHLDYNSNVMYEGDLTGSQLKLAASISAEHTLTRKAISIWPLDVRPSMVCLLDSRYAISFIGNFENKQLILHDNWNGQKHQISIKGQFPKAHKLENCLLKVINPECLLFIRNHPIEHPFFKVHLLRLNFFESCCRSVASRIFRGLFVDIIFDYKDRYKFAIRSTKRDNQYLWVGHIEEDRFIGINFTHLRYNLQFERMNNNVLQALSYNAGMWAFMEFDLSSRPCYPFFWKLYDVYSSKIESDLHNCSYRWFEAQCFIFAKNSIYKMNELSILDLETQELKSFNRNGFSFRGNIKTIYLGDDNVLTVCVEDSITQSFIIYRHPLNPVDTLANIAFFKMRRDALFGTNNAYHQSLHNLPSSLEPFPTRLPKLDQTPSSSRSSKRRSKFIDEPKSKRQKNY
ncbi:hypothetical protein M3Y97_00911100 [Aphelenchoides bicaudatus]|nr:hypothetical protein M3Y97_00911100 [Aphelenchoides bicaudatus]